MKTNIHKTMLNFSERIKYKLTLRTKKIVKNEKFVLFRVRNLTEHILKNLIRED
jgi:hypothetical protein